MNFVRALLAALLLSGCGNEPAIQLQPEAEVMFRGDPQHLGVYVTKGVRQFKEVKWAFKAQGPVRSTPAVANGAVYFGSGDSCLYAIEGHSGREKWRFKTGGAVHSSPAVSNGAEPRASG